MKGSYRNVRIISDLEINLTENAFNWRDINDESVSALK